MRKSDNAGAANPATKHTNGALSRMGRLWQSGLMLGLLALSTPAAASADGPILTARRGAYVCELPGNALSATGLRQPEEDFTIRASSVYTTTHGHGTYLASGDQIRMTSGPLAGRRYHRISDNYLRETDTDGHDGELRCVRKVLNN